MVSAEACLKLFEYTVRRVTAADVNAYAPQDPGYAGYVRAFTDIVESRKLPEKDDFSISETIALTRWSRADREVDPPRFRRFRSMTNAVGIALCATSVMSDDDMAGNYFAILFLDDVHELRDNDLLSLLAPAFEEFYAILSGRNSEQAPFLLLALLLARIQLGASSEEITRLADRIISEESKHFDPLSCDFLWGSTNHDLLHDLWRQHVVEFLKPSTGSVNLLRDALLQSSD